MAPAVSTPLQKAARNNLLSFTEYTYPAYDTNWHHRTICAYLDKLIAGDIKRLMIFTHPRAGKSELVSRRLPAYALGRNPELSIISASYGAALARRMNRDVQRIIDTDAYRELFPQTQLNSRNVRTISQGSYLRNSDMFEVVNHAGFYMSVGVGGALTGSGGQLLVIDDPVKNRKEANSVTYREAVWEWYTSTFYTRLAPGGSILITLTRWHEDDLAGRLLEAMRVDPDADQWTVINLPAIAEEPIPPYDPRKIGDVLWPKRWDKAEMARKRAVVGERDWASLYQQRPAPDEGDIFKRHWWRYWQPWGANLPPVIVKGPNDEYIEIKPVQLPRRFDEVLLSLDCSFKELETSDFVAGQTWGKSGADKFMLDSVNQRLDIVGTMQAIDTMLGKRPDARLVLVEDAANGPAVVQMMRRRVAGMVLVKPEGGKVSRAFAASPEVESGNVFLPHPAISPETERFIASCAIFPNAAHDDDVDAFTQAIIRWQGQRQRRRASSKEY